MGSSVCGNGLAMVIHHLYGIRPQINFLNVNLLPRPAPALDLHILVMHRSRSFTLQETFQNYNYLRFEA